MIARITESTRFETIAGNISNLQDGMSRASEQLSTQKKINQPSDDPDGARTVLNLRSAALSIDQYQANIMSGETWLKLTEANLSGIEDLLSQAEGVAQNVGASFGEHTAAAESLQNISDQILSFANATMNGLYLFSGSKTETKPFPDAAGAYQGDGGALLLNIGQNSTDAYNITGSAVFPPSADGNIALFQAFADLNDVLQDISSTDDDVSAALADFQVAVRQGYEQAQDNIAKTSVMLSNLEFSDTHLTYLKNRVAGMLSKTEDSDTAKLAMELQMQALTLNATYTVASRITEGSLVNLLQ